MRTGQMTNRYVPTSPLSPRPDLNHAPHSSQPASRSRNSHSRQSSRTAPRNIPRFHPGNFSHRDPTQAGPAGQAFTLSVPRINQPPAVDALRLLQENNRDVMYQAMVASRIAASPMGSKPDQPRLDPLGSPKGPMTPLELEGEGDYFQIMGGGKGSPTGSPGSRSDKSAKDGAAGDLEAGTRIQL